MTWWLKDSEVGLGVELFDDERLMGTFATKADADEVLGMHDLIVRQGGLLNGVVNAIRGMPPDDTLWSVHDAPELASKMMEQLNKLAMFASLMRGMLPVCTDTARLLIEELERVQKRMSQPIAERAE